MDEEEGDEIQDWGFLNKQAQTISLPTELLPKDESLPKRSAKFFEQDGSHVQLSKLDHARNQMYVALSSIRGHHVKQKLQAVWMSGQALVPHAKGGFFKDMGRPHVYPKKKKLQGIWLSGIEAVYLVERGSLIIYEASSSFEHFIHDESQDFDYETLSQMSLSYLYSVVFTKPEYSDRYQVYALLKRLGYLVMDFKQLDSQEHTFDLKLPSASSQYGISSVFVSLGTMARRWFKQMKLPRPQYFSTYTEVFQSLRIIPTYSAPRYAPPLPVEPEYQIVFNVWKPSPTFSKKNPPCPDFQVGVLNTSEVPLPSLSTIKGAWGLLNVPRPSKKSVKPKESQKAPKKAPKQTAVNEKAAKPLTKKELRSQRRDERESKMDPRLLNRNNYLRARDRKLKMGSTGRSIVYAIVDHGIINFTTFSETEFTLENHVSELDEIEARSSHGIMWNEQLDLT